MTSIHSTAYSCIGRWLEQGRQKYWFKNQNSRSMFVQKTKIYQSSYSPESSLGLDSTHEMGSIKIRRGSGPPNKRGFPAVQLSFFLSSAPLISWFVVWLLTPMVSFFFLCCSELLSWGFLYCLRGLSALSFFSSSYKNSAKLLPSVQKKDGQKQNMC